MSEKQDTSTIRASQVMSGALAAVTAAVLGSTMGVAGTVVGAGLASVVTTVGGALYLRSIQRTKQGVRTVRDIVVARAGSTSVTLVEEGPAPATGTDTDPATGTETGEATDGDANDGEADPEARDREEGTEQEPAHRRLRWPALIASSVLAFVLGMLVVSGVELLRGEQMSGGQGTTVGGIVRTQPDRGGDRDDAPPVTPESTTPGTGAPPVTVTEVPPTSENTEPGAPPAEQSTPRTTPPETTTGGTPTGSAPVPPSGQPG